MGFQLKGQTIARSMLEHYLSKPAPPLLILHGPAGVGKFSSAEWFIQCSLCEIGTGCGQCPSCRLFARQEHPDYILFPEERVLIGDEKQPAPFTVRWLIRTRLMYPPFKAERRFILIPRADLIQNEAETALLKTLEEPPDHTRFILMVEDLELLKETIISRGVCIPFHLIPSATMSEITGQSDPYILDLMGGSLELSSLILDESFIKLKEKIEDGLGHPMGLHELEIYVSLEKNFQTWKTHLDRSYEEVLDLIGLMILKSSERLPDFPAIADAVFDLKAGLHKRMAGMTHYHLSRFFARLARILFGH
ncbi:MAG TPA: hypothetical protein DEA96_10865 [Leptospiraceae bacterium]|nr:hypothetical protein [Spirochaetaceae bacterium]HBS05459.1 hypothetical protein [Leptospiraceae bacterium]|tara:strand:- start:195657 stop:196577 length:921 start_codon:yes stop_codon:yes gene_type:complete